MRKYGKEWKKEKTRTKNPFFDKFVFLLIFFIKINSTTNPVL